MRYNDDGTLYIFLRKWCARRYLWSQVWWN
jgi:hypothetical protein